MDTADAKAEREGGSNSECYRRARVAIVPTTVKAESGGRTGA